MADTYTSSLRIQLQATGGNSGTWGAIADTQYQSIESAITGDNGYAGGSGGVSIAGLSTYTLTANNGTADQSRELLYPFVGALTGDCVVSIPGVVKIGWALNATTGGHNVILQVGVGGKLTLTPGSGWTMFYCDSTNVTAPALSFLGKLTGAIPNALSGMILSNDGTTPNSVLDVSAGTCSDSTNAVAINLGAFTKSTAGSWAAGSGSNGMGQGLTVAASTWYHVFAIINAGLPDLYFDTSVTAANKPTSTTAFRRIGSILTDSSAHILAFTQNGDQFTWATATTDVIAQTVAQWASSSSFTLSVPPSVPVTVSFWTQLSNTVTWVGILSSPLVSAPNPGLQNNAGGTSALAWQSQYSIPTNTGQIRVSATAAGTTINVQTFGWTDQRGRQT